MTRRGFRRKSSEICVLSSAGWSRVHEHRPGSAYRLEPNCKIFNGKVTVVPGKNPDSLPPKLETCNASVVRSDPREYELESHHIKILQIVAENWDNYEAARNSIAENGMTFLNKSTATSSRGRKSRSCRITDSRS